MLTIIVVVVIGAIKDRPFTPQGSYVTTVAGSPDSHKFDLAAGQQLGVRFILSHSKNEDLSVRIYTVIEQGEGLWRRGSTLEDYGRVGDYEIVWFEAPGSGPYSLEVASHSGKSLHVTVEYSIRN